MRLERWLYTVPLRLRSLFRGREVIRRTLVLGGLGVAIGTIGALWAARLLATFLFEIQPTDPATFVVVALMILVAALAAGLVPARRATRVDPLVALRHEREGAESTESTGGSHGGTEERRNGDSFFWPISLPVGSAAPRHRGARRQLLPRRRAAHVDPMVALRAD